MGHLVASNDHQVVIERVHVSRTDKVLLSVVLEALLVESGLEMLKGQSVVENIS